MAQSSEQMIPVSTPPSRTIGILIFPEMEVLDFAGPFEVFSVAARISDKVAGLKKPPFEVVTVAETLRPLTARHGLGIIPHFSFDTCPKLDVLIAPGGVLNAPLASETTLKWIRSQSETAEITASVCNGALILAQTGLLDGITATTHWEHISELSEQFPRVDVVEGPSYVDQGKIVTSAGIAAGIEMSLHLVRHLIGPTLAGATARQMQYDWSAA